MKNEKAGNLAKYVHHEGEKFWLDDKTPSDVYCFFKNCAAPGRFDSISIELVWFALHEVLSAREQDDVCSVIAEYAVRTKHNVTMSELTKWLVSNDLRHTVASQFVAETETNILTAIRLGYGAEVSSIMDRMTEYLSREGLV